MTTSSSTKTSKMPAMARRLFQRAIVGSHIRRVGGTELIVLVLHHRVAALARLVVVHRLDELDGILDRQLGTHSGPWHFAQLVSADLPAAGSPIARAVPVSPTHPTNECGQQHT